MISLSKALEDYLLLRRGLGFKLSDPCRLLPRFLAFLKEHKSSHITTDLAVKWATKPGKSQPSTWAQRLGMVRLFAEYVKGWDPQTEIPPKKILPNRYHRKQPYIYSDKEVAHLLEAARRLPSTFRGVDNLRALTYSTLFGLLAVTGMRVRSEALSLNREDVDLKDNVITIHCTKFRKTRLVPIHETTSDVLRHYSSFRDRIFPNPKTSSFFVSQGGKALGYDGTLYTFTHLSREIGLRGPSDSHGPRMHDFRHRFAVQTLIRWYRSGVDVDRHILELSTYLGHVKVSDTYWYLSMVPELLKLVTARLEKKGEQT
jgi:integrase/recombinase XerD